MSNWEWKKLGDVCDIYQPQTISAKELVENGKYLVYGANGVIGRYDKYNHNDSEILLTCRGATCGSINVSEPFSWINGNAMVVHPKNDSITKSYLKLTLALLDFSHIITGTAQPQITRTSLSPAIIPVPQLAEQKRIVKTLDEKFAKIDKIKTAAETNLKNARELFNAELNSKLNVENENLPQGWETKSLNEITTIRPPKNRIIEKLKSSDMVSFLPMEDLNIRERNISALKKKCLSEVQGSYTAFADGDVLLAKVTPCFENGKLGIANNLSNGVGFGSSEYIVFRCDNSLLNVYLFYVLMSPSFVDGGKKKMLGACGLKRLSKDYVENFQIPLPPLSEQKRIVAHLDKLSEKVKRLEEIYRRTIADCEELKKSILKKTFEGES